MVYHEHDGKVRRKGDVYIAPRAMRILERRM